MRLFLNKKNAAGRSKPYSMGRIKPSYYGGSAKAANPSPFSKKPLSKKTFKLRVRHFVRFIVAILIITVAVFCTLIKATPKVIVSDTSYHTADDYEIAVKTALKAFRNHSKITLDRSGISRSLQKQFPELDGVHIEVPIISQIATIRLNIAAPTFNFASGSNLFVVGSNGVVASKSSLLSSSAKLPTLIDQSGFEAVPGKQVLGTNSIGFINTLIAQTKLSKLQINSLTLPAAPQELDLRAAGSGYFVKFDLNGDALLQAGQYLSAKHKFDSEGGGPEQYLDVRVAGKIYYK